MSRAAGGVEEKGAAMRGLSKAALIAIALALAAACGGGGGSGGTDYDLADEPMLIGYWVRDAGVSPMTQAWLNDDGSFSGVFVNGCEVAGKWYTGDDKLKLAVKAISSSSLCGYYDIENGTSLVQGYTFVTFDQVSIVNRDGTTWYIRAP